MRIFFLKVALLIQRPQIRHLVRRSLELHSETLRDKQREDYLKSCAEDAHNLSRTQITSTMQAVRQMRQADPVSEQKT